MFSRSPYCVRYYPAFQTAPGICAASSSETVGVRRGRHLPSAVKHSCCKHLLASADHFDGSQTACACKSKLANEPPTTSPLRMHSSTIDTQRCLASLEVTTDTWQVLTCVQDSSGRNMRGAWRLLSFLVICLANDAGARFCPLPYEQFLTSDGLTESISSGFKLSLALAILRPFRHSVVLRARLCGTSPMLLIARDHLSSGAPFRHLISAT